MVTRSRQVSWGILAIIVLAVSSCARGRVSSIAYSGPPQGASFTVLLPDSPTLTDKNIGTLISKEMTARGFVPAADADHADLRIQYSYNISAGKHVVSSSYNQATGMTDVHSATLYPRYFEVKIFGPSPKSRGARPDHVVWQAELYSQGSRHNISWLADAFIPALFEHFDRSATNESFIKMP